MIGQADIFSIKKNNLKDEMEILQDNLESEEQNKQSRYQELENLDIKRQNSKNDYKEIIKNIGKLSQKKDSLNNDLQTIKSEMIGVKNKLQMMTTEMLRNESQKINHWMSGLKSWQRQRIDLSIDIEKINQMNLGQNFINKILGKVYNFFNVNDSKYQKAVNNMIKANIFKTVVKDANTAEMILKYNLLKGVKVLLPLDKLRVPGFSILAKKIISKDNSISTNQPDLIVITKARNLVRHLHNAEVYLPYELIEYDQKNKKLINFVFSNYLVCSNMDVGRVLCDELGVRCVTLDGERIEPGILVGGFQERTSDLLLLCKEYYKKKMKLEKIEQELRLSRELEKEEKKLFYKEQDVLRELKEIEHQKDKAEERLENLNKNNDENLKKLKEKEILQIEDRIRSIENKIQEKEEELTKLNKSNKKKGQVKDVVQEIKKEEKELNNLKTKIYNLESKEDSMSSIIKTHQTEIIKIKEELITLKSEYKQDKLNLKNQEFQKETLDRELEALKIDLNVITEKNTMLHKKKKKVENEITIISNQRNELIDLKENIQKEIDKINQDIKKNQENLNDISQDLERSFALNELETSMKQVNKELKHLIDIKEDDNIETITSKMNQIHETIVKLENDENNLRRKLNPKSEDWYHQLEKDFKQIGLNKGIVQKNRNVMTTNIISLNKKKYTRVIKCFEIVNKNLLEMFTSLVPGAKAKMILKNYPPTENDYEIENKKENQSIYT